VVAVIVYAVWVKLAEVFMVAHLCAVLVEVLVNVVFIVVAVSTHIFNHTYQIKLPGL